MTTPEIPCARISLEQRVEALIFSSERPISESRMKTVLGIEDDDATKKIKAAIETLNATYDKNARAFRIERVAGGYRPLTREEFAPLVSNLYADRQQQKLSQAALETLSIIAYRQPVMRAEIEVIRGVACGEVLRSIMEKRLVKIVGRAEELGRPMLYGTTREFLSIFGLATLDDLPDVQGLVREASWKPATVPESENELETTETTDSPQIEPTEVVADTETTL
jgi:segregation and condensation protein B